MSLFFYNLFVSLYQIGIKLIAFRSPKAKLWLEGRSGIFKKLQYWKNELNISDKIIWVHCASLGEFEQGRPIIENIKKDYPHYKILLTFFSPSGFEVRKNYNQVDAVFYLPMDGKQIAQQFIDIVKPNFVIWVKYEYWYHYLTTLKTRNIPLFLVSAKFRDTQPFFKWYGGLWIKILQSFTHLFLQNDETSAVLLEKILIKNFTIAGDTRFDRVVAIANNKNILPEEIISFCKNEKVIVAGSTWEEDEELLLHYANVHPEIKFIIAPHDIDVERIADVKKIFKNAKTFSDMMEGEKVNQILIIDNIGMLSQLYKLGDVAFIGGGFNDSGIHNILEAAVYGKPIIFGQVYEKFTEAVDLVNAGGAYTIESALALETLLDKLFMDKILLENASSVSKQYVIKMQGATNKIINYLHENRLLTSS